MRLCVGFIASFFESIWDSGVFCQYFLCFFHIFIFLSISLDALVYLLALVCVMRWRRRDSRRADEDCTCTIYQPIDESM
jgi:hypothetical protein